jgi:hypothetical protein
MSVSFSGGMILELEREDDYHRIDWKASKSEPPAVAGEPAFDLEVLILDEERPVRYRRRF